MTTPKSLASIFGATAVALGAFGAHALRGKVDVDQLDIWKTASLYHLLHSVVLLALSSQNNKSVATKLIHAPLSFKLIATGTLIFSGSLYLLVITNIRKFGAITPIGGILLIAGWLAIIFED
jgi:uncharacterized membrane protein YgdD (TMEM256/DUF423 family)